MSYSQLLSISKFASKTGNCLICNSVTYWVKFYLGSHPWLTFTIISTNCLLRLCFIYCRRSLKLNRWVTCDFSITSETELTFKKKKNKKIKIWKTHNRRKFLSNFKTISISIHHRLSQNTKMQTKNLFKNCSNLASFHKFNFAVCLI